MSCPICHGADGQPHASGCFMECPTCKPPCGTGHQDGCDPWVGPESVDPNNALLRFLRRTANDKEQV